MNSLLDFVRRATRLLPPATPTDVQSVPALSQRLDTATSYQEWGKIAQELDKLMGNETWKRRAASRDYDYRLIQFRLNKLRHWRKMTDVISLMQDLRSGLLRNFGGSNDARLFARSFIGTKYTIEEYMSEVVSLLDFIAETPFSDCTPQVKMEFFHETKQSFGCTALVLQGGATIGLYHLGVVKALYEQKLLPRIISGSAVGALIAALVCIHSDDELKVIFDCGGVDLQAFTRVGQRGNFRRKVARWLKYGYLLDVKVLEDCVRSNVGDLTFEEAFYKTRRVLNITVSSSRTHEVPKVLNYLTAPNVLIWSAACASTTATYPLYIKVDLLAKDTQGNIKKWSPTGSDIKWGDSSSDKCAFSGTVVFTLLTCWFSSVSESPHERLAELFNVNHFIVSQAGAMVAPFVVKRFQDQNPISSRIVNAVMMEVRHRTQQAASVGLVPSFLARWLAPESVFGDVTIAPELRFRDYANLFNNPTSADVDYWIRKGEQSTWPMISLIRNRCAIEVALDTNLTRMRQLLNDRISKSARLLSMQQGRPHADKKRHKSIH
ncbi:triacylglycerol lipase [Sorochytrium milnesiophthora]